MHTVNYFTLALYLTACFFVWLRAPMPNSRRGLFTYYGYWAVLTGLYIASSWTNP